MKTERPNSVKMAMRCLIVSFGAASVQMLSQIRWSDLVPYIPWILACFAVWFLIWMIYRGKNWARWIYAGLTVNWLVVLAANIKFTTRLNGVAGALLVLYVVLGLTAACLLFSPASNKWFRTEKKYP